MLQSSLSLWMSWIEGESLLVIGDGRFFHFGSLTFLTHDDIFRGKALEEFLLFLFLFILLPDYFPQTLVLRLQFIHLVEFLTDETFGKRVLDVVTAMDG